VHNQAPVDLMSKLKAKRFNTARNAEIELEKGLLIENKTVETNSALLNFFML
jgi:hypothetical protein